jgi:hypothetical protein
VIPARGQGQLPIGSNEDSLGTVYGQFKPKPVSEKIQRNAGRLIRSKAKMVDPSPIDAPRVFFVVFHMEDDTLEVCLYVR